MKTPRLETVRTLVADASAAAMWFILEEDSPRAARLKSPAIRLIAPDWIVAECAQVFWKRAKAGDISGEYADWAIRNLPRWFADFSPAAELAPRALTIARELNHSVYDCVYLALAEREKTKVATADARFLKAAQKGGWGGFVISLRDATG